MITDLLQVKGILGKTTTYLTATDIETVIGACYRIYQNSTGDFTNIGASDNVEGTTFIATGDTPTDWGDGVLQVITDEDLRIESLIYPMTEFIVSYTQNDFTDIQYVDINNRRRTKQISYSSDGISFSGNTLSDTSAGLDFLKYSDFMIVGDTQNYGYYTVKSQTASTIETEEALETESAGEDITLYAVRWPKNLKDAIAYMINDELTGDAMTDNATSESIGKYSISFAGASGLRQNVTTYNSNSINILNCYRRIKPI
jgi:hypothetical protein